MNFYLIDAAYTVTIRTGDQVGAGTKGPVVINLIDKDKRATGWLYLQTREGSSALTAGSVEKFVFNAPSIADVAVIDVSFNAKIDSV